MTAIVLFFQIVGGTFMVSTAQAAPVNVLVKVLTHSAPGVKPAAVVSTGATDLRKVFLADQLFGILVAYSSELKIAFAIALASSGMTFIITTLFQR